MKTIEELESKHDYRYSGGYKDCKKDVVELIDEIQDKASNERKINKDKRYWLGCCQILNELKERIEG